MRRVSHSKSEWKMSDRQETEEGARHFGMRMCGRLYSHVPSHDHSSCLLHFVFIGIHCLSFFTERIVLFTRSQQDLYRSRAWLALVYASRLYASCGEACDEASRLNAAGGQVCAAQRWPSHSFPKSHRTEATEMRWCPFSSLASGGRRTPKRGS